MSQLRFLAVLTIQVQQFDLSTNKPLQEIIDSGINLDSSCEKGSHLVNNKCVKNTDWCHNAHYDPTTYSCNKCKWWTFHVKHDKFSSSTGNYCETRWYLWVIIIQAIFFVILIILLIICWCCCRKDKEWIPLRKPPTYKPILIESPPS